MRASLMLAMWLAAGVQLYAVATQVRDHLVIVGARGLRGQPAASTPFAMAYLSGAVDAQEWVSHAQSLLEGHSLQLRHTDIDNAPFGREVHWNSAWAWTIAGAGWLRHQRTGEPLTTALERATIWLNPVVLMVVIVLISWFAARRAGALAGLAVAIAMVGLEPFTDGFLPGYVDHHGLLTAAVFGMMLSAVFMGGGWWRENDSGPRLLPQSPSLGRSGAIISAICGALGLWVSAASVIAPIAMVGAAGVAAVLACGRTAARGGAQYDGRVWRTWGRAGAIGSLAFYLLEYFPSHLGVRLEVNHPLYALAWWGGGELIAEVTERWLAPRGERWRNPRLLITALALVLIAPLTIVIGGGRFFAPSDPFLAHMYHAFLPDFSSMWGLRDHLHWNPYASVIGIENVPLLAGLCVLAVRRQLAPPLVWFATSATLAFTMMAWWQMRWLDNASGPQICLALVLAAHFTLGRVPIVRWSAALGVFAVMFMPGAIHRVTEMRARVEAKEVSPKEAMFMVDRDIAAALRASQPLGEITLLTDPNASLSIGYYGRIKTIGTAFWENIAGLKAAADIFAARSGDEAAALIRARKVTHIATIVEEDFSPAYYQLLHPDATEEDYQESFGYHLNRGEELPQWLAAVPYIIPEDLRDLGVTVRLYKVDFTQTPNDALYRDALAEFAAGRSAQAERDFDTLIKRDSTSHLAWLGKSELLFARHEWSAAAGAALSGIARASSADRTRLYGWTASNFLRQNQPTQAIRLYRAALSDGFNADIACSLSFVFATSTDDRLRNGAEALALARRAVRSMPESPMYLNCLGASLAEAHQFTEAIAVAERAAKSARAQGDVNVARVSDALLAAFRAGKPWRE